MKRPRFDAASHCPGCSQWVRVVRVVVLRDPDAAYALCLDCADRVEAQESDTLSRLASYYTP